MRTGVPPPATNGWVCEPPQATILPKHMMPVCMPLAPLMRESFVCTKAVKPRCV